MKPRLILSYISNDETGNLNWLVIEVTSKVLTLRRLMQANMKQFATFPELGDFPNPGMQIYGQVDIIALKQLPPCLEDHEPASISGMAVLLPADMEMSDVRQDCTDHETSSDSYDPDFERRINGDYLFVDHEGDVRIFLHEHDSEEDDSYTEELTALFDQIETETHAERLQGT